MKKLFTICLSLFIATQVMAGKGNIVVFSEDGDPFYVVVNGIRQNINPETNVKITGLNAGGSGINLRVIFKDEKIKPISKNFPLGDDIEITFKLKRSKKGEVAMKYFGEVPIGSSTSTATSYAYSPVEPTATVTTTGTGTASSTGTGNTTVSTGVQGTGTQTTTTYTETVTTQTGTGTTGVSTGVQGGGTGVGTTMTVTGTGTGTTTGTGENVNVNMNVGGVGMNVNVNVTETGMGTSTGVTGTGTGTTGVSTGTTGVTSGTTYTQTTTTTTTSTTGTGVGMNTTVNTTGTGVGTGTTSTGTTTTSTGTGNSSPCYVPMSDADFVALKKSIESKSFADSKQSVAEQAVKSKCATSAQVRDIMKLFSFEEDRLEFAKFAYSYTTDRSNYYQVNDAFSFELSIDDLKAYLDTQK